MDNLNEKNNKSLNTNDIDFAILCFNILIQAKKTLKYARVAIIVIVIETLLLLLLLIQL